jgi:cysteinyl-tRNA synthetase
MDSDLDTPGALAQVFGLVTRINSLLDAGDVDSAGPLLSAWRSMLSAMGLDLRDASADEVPDEVLALAKARDNARSAKEWGLADELRNELQLLGWIVDDTSEGTRVRRP